MTSKIIETSSVRDNQTRVIFEHTDDAGVNYGPFVEHRPKDEDLDKFVETHGQNLEASLNKVPESTEDSLLKTVLSHDDVTVKSALSIDDSKLASLKQKLEVD